MPLRTLLKITMVVVLALSVSGCALIGTAISAGISYGIYQATR